MKYEYAMILDSNGNEKDLYFSIKKFHFTFEELYIQAELKIPEGLEKEKIKYRVNDRHKLQNQEWESNDTEMLFKINLVNGMHTGED